MRTFLLCLLLAGWWHTAHAQLPQTRLELVKTYLDSCTETIPALRDTVYNAAFNRVPLYDVFRALGKAHGLNVFVEDNLNQPVTFLFDHEPVKNVLLFLCRQFSLEPVATGGILYFNAYQAPPPVIKPPVIREPVVVWDSGKVSMDLVNDSLTTVVRKLARLSGVVIVPSREIRGTVTALVPPSELFPALRAIFPPDAYEITPDLDYPNSLYIKPINLQANNGFRQGGGFQQGGSQMPHGRVNATSRGDTINLSVTNANLEETVRTLFNEVNYNYLLYDKLEGDVTLSLTNLPFNEALRLLLQPTKFTYQQDGMVYLIGARTRENLRQTEMVSLKYRPTSKAIELIPEKMKEDVMLKEYPELNKIILSGSPERIAALKAFIIEIDKPVPMVKIEMLVMDVNISRLLNTGIKAGVGQRDTSGVTGVLPGIDVKLSGDQLNALLGMSGIPYLSNLGILKSSVYLQVQAQESRGNVKVLTRPVISTLNGTKASLTIGEKQYFKLLTNTLATGVGTPVTQTTETFREIEYNTTLDVTPYVSDDNMLTLQLEPNFTTPGAQASPTLPPTMLTRKFSSTIRIRNGETVILGGLSRESQNNSTEGLPFISRVPVLKWIFGSNSRSHAESSLIIYITPTIVYY